MSRSPLRYLAAICGLVLIAFVARVPSLDSQSLWRDEVDALCFAYQFPNSLADALRIDSTSDPGTPCACPPSDVTVQGESVLERVVAALSAMIHHNGPLYYFLLRGWVEQAGTTGFSLRFLSVLFGVLCVPLSYVLGRRLFSIRVGLLTAVLMAVSAYMVYYAQEVKMYTLVPALSLLAIYALRRACEGDGSRWWVVQVVSTSLAFYCHIFAALLVPVQLLLYLCWWPLSRRHWRTALVSLACLILPYVPLVVWQAPQALKARETGFPYRNIVEIAETLINSWSLGLPMWGWPWGSLVSGGLAVFGILSPAFSRSGGEENERGTGWGRSRLALICWMVAPPLIIWAISLWQPLFVDRYLIWCAPAFFLLVSAGLTTISQLEIRRAEGVRLDAGRWVAISLIGILIISSTVNLWRQATESTKSDFRAAAAYLEERVGPDELIIFQIPHSRYTFDYYFEGSGYIWIDGLYTNHRNQDGSYMMSEREASWRMQAMTMGFERIWLVLSEESMWDERALTRGWLESNYILLDEAHLLRVDTYLYAAPDTTTDSRSD